MGIFGQVLTILWKRDNWQVRAALLLGIFLLLVGGVSFSWSASLTGELSATTYSLPGSVNSSTTGKFAEGVLDDDGNLWLVPMNASAVIKVNTSTGTITSYSDWPAGLNGREQYKFRSAVYDGQNGLWLIPFAAEQIVRLDTRTGAMTAYSAWPAGFDTTVSAKFIGGVYHNGSIYLIPSLAPSVIKVDIATGTMTNFGRFPDDLFLSTTKFAGGVKDQAGNLWLIPSNANMVVKLNLSSGTATGYADFPNAIDPYDAAKFTGGALDGAGNLWLVPNSAACVVKMNTSSGAMTAYDGFPVGITAGSTGKFAGGVFDGNDLWLVPHSAGSLVRITPATGAMTGYNTISGGFSLAGGAQYMGGVLADSSLWLIPYNASQLVKISAAVTPDASLSLTADTSAVAFTPQGVPVQLTADQTIRKAEYFCLNTTDSTIVTADSFTAQFSQCPSAHKGSISGNGFTAGSNGTYWVRAVFSDGTSSVAQITIANIYTACLSVQGIDQEGQQLYLEQVAKAHGLPLDLDGTLLANPPLGYQEAQITARAISGYHVSGSAIKRVALNSRHYLTAPNNVITFAYLANDNSIDPELPVSPEPEPDGGNQDGKGNNGAGNNGAEENNPGDLDSGNNGETDSPDDEVDHDELTGGSFPQDDANVLPTEDDSFGVDIPENDFISEPPLEFIDEETGQKFVTYTLTRLAHRRDYPSQPYYIVDEPSPALRLHQVDIPAFTNGSGITYTLLYKTADSARYQALATDLPAWEPYTFQNDLALAATEITLHFPQVPSGFGEGDQIIYTFAVLDSNYTNSYHTIWNNPNQAENSRTVLLTKQLAELRQLLAQTQDPEQQAHLQELIQYAEALLEDPYVSAHHLAQATAALADILQPQVLADGLAQQKKPLLLTSRYLIPGMIGLGAWLVLAVLLMKRRNN